MALTLDEKIAKSVEIHEKEVELDLFDLADREAIAEIRNSYDFQAMNEEINNYVVNRAAEKAALADELKLLKEELVAE